MWEGIVTLRAGDQVVGVEYDSVRTRDSIERACSGWLVDDLEVDSAAFGIRRARVGLLRRSVGVLHHGAPVRGRFDGVDAAALALDSIIRDLAQGSTGRVARVKGRLFVRGDRAVIAEMAPAMDIDHGTLWRNGVVEVHLWRPSIDLDSGQLVAPGCAFSDFSWLVLGPAISPHEDLRQHVWDGALDGDVGLAWFVDSLGDRLRCVLDPPTDAVLSALR